MFIVKINSCYSHNYPMNEKVGGIRGNVTLRNKLLILAIRFYSPDRTASKRIKSRAGVDGKPRGHEPTRSIVTGPQNNG